MLIQSITYFMFCPIIFIPLGIINAASVIIQRRFTILTFYTAKFHNIHTEFVWFVFLHIPPFKA